MRIYKSAAYNEYITNSNTNIEVDKKFIIDILDKHVLNNNVFQHMLKEESIYWLDDLPFVSILLVSQIKNFSEEKQID